MAKSTCNPNVDVPKGMMRFEVIRTTIRDSLGQYCVPGDMAVLTKDNAQAYLDQNLIRVALPDFDEAEDEQEKGDTAEEVGEDEAERPTPPSNSRRSPAQRRARSAANG